MSTKGSGDAVKFVGSVHCIDDLKTVLGGFDLDFLSGCDNFKHGFRTLPATTAWVSLEPSGNAPKLVWIKSEKAFRVHKGATTWLLKSRGEVLFCPDPGSAGYSVSIRNETTPTTTVQVEYFVAGKRG